MKWIVYLLIIFVAVELMLIIYRTLRHIFHKYISDSWVLFRKDDFVWSGYNQIYRRELKDISQTNSQILLNGKYSLKDGRLIIDNSMLPLHPNHKLLYETVLKLDPKTILEIGCGGGDHLSNLKRLLPNAALYGCDLLQDQIDLLKQRHPELVNGADLSLCNITVSKPNYTADLVYTQAVIMHIQKGNSHMNALRNLFKLSKKYVILMENWKKHDFVADINKISKEKDFPWKELFLYKIDSGQQILMIASNLQLNGLEKLNNDKQLQKYFI